MSAVVQAVLSRRRKAREKQEKEEEDEEKESNVVPASPQSGAPREITRTTAEEETKLYKATLTLADFEGVENEKLKLVKDRWVERLVLENSMESSIARCFLFLVYYVFFLMMLYMSYPSPNLLPVHQALTDHFELADTGEDGTAFVDGLDELKVFLRELAFKSRDFSPGSSVYVVDHFSKAYLEEEMAFYDTPYKVPSDNIPVLTKDFTIMVWIKTKLRFQTILEKKDGDKTCWSFGMEKVLYGEHLSAQPLTVVNPLAQSIGEDYETSAFKSALQDGHWHHVAIAVKGGLLGGSVTYFHDGEPQASVPLVQRRPITDCMQGSVTIGYPMAATLVDLKFYPRVISSTGLKEIINGGKILDDMLAGNGAQIKEDTDLAKLITWTLDADTKSTNDRQGIEDHVEGSVRKISDFVLQSHQNTKTTVGTLLATNLYPLPAIQADLGAVKGSLHSDIKPKVDAIHSNVGTVKSDVSDVKRDVQDIVNHGHVRRRLDNHQGAYDDDVSEDHEPGSSHGTIVVSSRSRSKSKKGDKNKNKIVRTRRTPSRMIKSTNNKLKDDVKRLVKKEVVRRKSLEETYAFNKQVMGDIAKQSTPTATTETAAKTATTATTATVESMRRQPEALDKSKNPYKATLDSASAIPHHHHHHREITEAKAEEDKKHTPYKKQQSKKKTERRLQEQGESCTDTATDCFKKLIDKAIRKLAKLATDAVIEDAEIDLTEVLVEAPKGDRKYGRCAVWDQGTKNCVVEECYTGVVKEDKRTREMTLTGKYDHLVYGKNRDVIDILNGGTYDMTMNACTTFFKGIVLPLFQCIVKEKNAGTWAGDNASWGLLLDNDGNYDVKNENWGALGFPTVEEFLTNCEDKITDDFFENSDNYDSPSAYMGSMIYLPQKPDGSYVQDCKDPNDPENFDYTCKKELKHIAAGWVITNLVYLVKMESLSYCALGSEGASQCAKMCGWCSLMKMPSEGQLKSTLLSCKDDAGYVDWMGRGCSWYKDFDQPTCLKFGSDETREKCKLTCNNCKVVKDIMDVFATGTNEEVGWVYSDYNNFCTVTHNSNMRNTVLTWEDVVAGMCLAGMPAPDAASIAMFDKWSSYFQTSRASAYLFANFVTTYGMAGTGQSTPDERYLIKTWLECIVANTEFVTVSLVGSERSPFLAIINESATGVKASLAPPWSFGKPGDVRKYAERYQVHATRIMPASLTWETTVKGNYKAETIYPLCGTHEDCASWDNLQSRESFLCMPTLDVLDVPPNQASCTNYGYSKRLFCSIGCYTGGCGKNTTAMYQEKPKESGKGYCQPCNGCTVSAKGTSIDEKCPEFCKPPKVTTSKFAKKKGGGAPSPGGPEEGMDGMDPMGMDGMDSMGMDPMDRGGDMDYKDPMMDTGGDMGYNDPMMDTGGDTGYNDPMMDTGGDTGYNDPMMDTGGDTGYKDPMGTLRRRRLHLGHSHILAPIIGSLNATTSLGDMRLMLSQLNDIDDDDHDGYDEEDVESSLTRASAIIRNETHQPFPHEQNFKNRDSRAIPRRRLACHGENCWTSVDPDVAGSFALMAWVKDMNIQYIAKKSLVLPEGMMFGNLTTVKKDVDPHVWTRYRGYNNETREMICWSWTIDEFCFRAKWSDPLLTCRRNPKAELLRDGQWHHYALLNKAKEELDFTTLPATDKLYSLIHSEEMMFYVDGQETAAEGDRLPGWGMTDCAGPTVLFFPVPEARNDEFMGKSMPYDLLKPENDPKSMLDRKLKEKVGNDYVDKHFPMSNLAPLGSKDSDGTITGFRFSNVNVPKNAFIHSAFLSICAGDLYANYMATQLEGCYFRQDYMRYRGRQLNLTVYGDADTAHFSKEQRSLPDKTEDENCCTFANTLPTTASVNWTIDIDSWRQDAVIPGPEQVSYPLSSGDCKKEVDVTDIIKELTTNESWDWGSTMTLLVAPRNRTISPSESCSATTECADLFPTPQKSKAKQRPDIATNKGTGNCVDSAGNLYDGYWVQTNPDGDKNAKAEKKNCGTLLISLNHKAQARGAEWFESGDEGKKCRILVDDKTNPLAWADEDKVTWTMEGDPEVASSPFTAGTGTGDVANVATTGNNVATTCFSKDGAGLCASRSGTVKIEDAQCRCYNPSVSKPTPDGPICEIGSYCYAMERDVPKCLSHLHYSYLASIDGSQYNECYLLYKLGKPADATPVWFISYEGSSSVSGASGPSLYVEWCYNSDCLSPQFFNAGADGIYGTQGFDPWESNANYKTFETKYGPFPSSRILETETRTDNTTKSVWEEESRNDATEKIRGRQQHVTSREENMEGMEEIRHRMGQMEVKLELGGQNVDDRTTMRRHLSPDRETGIVFNSTHGELIDETGGGLKLGQVFHLSVVSRLMATSEIQNVYYDQIKDVQELGGPSEVLESTHPQSSIEVEAYPNEIISIIPPIVFQQRSQMRECGKYIPGLNDPMINYFSAQTNLKCKESYTCEFPENAEDPRTNFGCVDRKGYLDSSIDATQQWFGRDTVELNIDEPLNGYSEFLDMMTFSKVYRDGDIRSIDDWLDLRSSIIVSINIFMVPSTRSGTVMYTKWMYEGPGKMSFILEFYSYYQMGKLEQKIWLALNLICIFMCILDLVLLLRELLQRWARRRMWYKRVRSKGARDNYADDMQCIRENVIMFEMWDLFDVALRVLFILFLLMHKEHYESLHIEETNQGHFEEKIYEILHLPWGDQQMEYNEKVSRFFTIVVDLMALLTHDRKLRTYAYFLVFLAFIRLVVYMRVHPRMAVLYKTVCTAADDLLHFLIVCGLLFIVLLFQAIWTFGGRLSEFSSVFEGSVSQYRMLIGDFPFDQRETLSGEQFLYFLYIVVFSLAVFFFLLNFFLAIVVDSYAAVKEQVTKSVVERMVLLDIMYLGVFQVFHIIFSWPNRTKLLDTMLMADMDMDMKDDEEQEADTVVCTPQALVFNHITKDLKTARSLMGFYLWVCPDLHIEAEEDNPELEHQTSFKRIRKLDILLHKLMNRKVSGVTAASNEETVVRLLSTMTQKLDRVGFKLDFLTDNEENENDGYPSDSRRSNATLSRGASRTSLVESGPLAGSVDRRATTKLSRRTKTVSRQDMGGDANRIIADRITMYTEGARILSEALVSGKIQSAEDADMELFMVEWHLKSKFLDTKKFPENVAPKPPVGMSEEEKDEFIGKFLQS